MAYSKETATAEIMKIKEAGPYRLTHTIKHDKELVKFIEDKFAKNYPNEKESLSAKVWLLLHPGYELTCLCGKRLKFKKSRNGMKFNCIFSCPNTIQNREKTIFKKYGVFAVQQLPAVRSKSVSTCLLKYGSKSANGNKDIMSKQITTRKNKCLESYGVCHEKQVHFSAEARNILNDKEKFSRMLSLLGSRTMAKQLGVSQSTIVVYHRKLGLNIISRVRSCYEIELANWLQNKNILFKQNDLTQIKPKELDFYLPEYKIGIEIQGNYWHGNPKLYKSTDLIRSNRGLISVSEIWKKDKHKQNLCEQKDIRLITFWEDD